MKACVFLALTGLLTLLNLSSRSQQLSDQEKRKFSAQITTVKFWTYLSEDSAYRALHTMPDLVHSTLARKGYLPEQAVFSPGHLKSASEWEQDLIAALDSNEAFVVLVMFPIPDPSNLGIPPVNQVTIVNPLSGATMVTPRMSVPSTEQGKRVFYHSMIAVYTKGYPNSSGQYTPLLMKFNNRNQQDPDESAAFLLNKLPRQAKLNTAQSADSAFTPYTDKAEFALSAGYLFPSSMDVTQGTADFYGNLVYGVEISLGFSGNVDLTGSFFRQVTRYNLHSTRAENIDNPMPVSLNYMFLGCNYNFRLSKHWTVFLGGSVGGVNLVQENHLYRDVWYLAFAGQGGGKVYLLPWLGLRLQAQVLYQLHPEGAPFLYRKDGTPYPIDSYSNMPQFGIAGGMFFRVGSGRRW